MSAPIQRYTAVAIVLHWAIAAAILFNLPLGFWMHMQAEDGAATEGLFRAFQLHKSIGLTVLMLSLMRLGWRLANPPPPLPTHMPAWEKFAAKATHWGFYALMIGLPLSGWLFVSAGWSLHENRSLATPTEYFGLFRVPPLFGLPQAGGDVRAEVADVAFDVHVLLAYLMIGLGVLHVGAALKHQAYDRDEVMAHMVPGLRAPNETEPAPRNQARLAILGGGLALVTLALAGALYAASTFGEARPAQAPEASQIEIAPGAEAPMVAPEAPQAAPTAAAPPIWRADARASSIRFAYVYEDESGAAPFEGRFTRWRANIRFDPENLLASAADVTIEIASASTGATAHDTALPSAEWFNAAAYPTARFRTREIRRSGDGYVADGDLTIRDRTRRVRLPFTLSFSGSRAVMEGRVSIDRRDFDVGDGAEGDDLISRDIALTIHVEATRAP